MNKNEIFEIIRLLAVANKDDNNKRYKLVHDNHREYRLWNTHYLLGQVLRQYDVPLERNYVSKKAKELWHKLGIKEDINNFFWKENLDCNCENVVVKCYTGASNKYEEKTVSLGTKLEYRSVFHNEHIIPIDLIREELERLADENNLTDEKIEELLNKICICRITKEEDRSIKYKYKRSLDLRTCYNEVYKKTNNEPIIIEELENANYNF